MTDFLTLLFTGTSTEISTFLYTVVTDYDALRRYPFQVKPLHIDHYREYPLLPRKKMLSVLILFLEALESDESEDEQDVPGVNTTYDHPDHVVTVTTISDVNLDSGKFACIGPNKVSNSLS